MNFHQNPRPLPRLLAAIALCCIASASSCSTSERETSDSQTHFFDECRERSECGGLDCICGRCTAACDDGECTLPSTVCLSQPASTGCAAGSRICAPRPDGGPPADGAPPPEAGPCEGLSLEDCLATPQCKAIRPVLDTEQPAPFIECQVERGCTEAETCADGDGYGCLKFPDGCTPTGWEVVDCSAPTCPDDVVVAELQDCTLETMMEYVTGGNAGRLCGDLQVDAAASKVAAAEACSLGAASEDEPFTYVSEFQGIDSVERSAIVGVKTGGEFEVYAINYDSNGFNSDVPSPFDPDPVLVQADLLRCDSLDTWPSGECTGGHCLMCGGFGEGLGVLCACRLKPGTTGPGRLYCDEPFSALAGGLKAASGSPSD